MKNVCLIYSMLNIENRIDPLSFHVNIAGIVLWTALYLSLSIHEFPRELFHVHIIFVTMILLFLSNMFCSDTLEGTFDVEMKFKENVENLSTRLCILLITVLFSTSVLSRYKHVPKKVKQHFMSILCMAIVLLLGISSCISIPKKASHVRRLRKYEAMVLNIVIGLISVAFVYMIHYM